MTSITHVPLSRRDAVPPFTKAQASANGVFVAEKQVCRRIALYLPSASSEFNDSSNFSLDCNAQVSVSSDQHRNSFQVSASIFSHPPSCLQCDCVFSLAFVVRLLGRYGSNPNDTTSPLATLAGQSSGLPSSVCPRQPILSTAPTVRVDASCPHIVSRS